MSKKIITKKEHLILILLLIFRFVNSKQIQEFLKHKDHRRINSWLKDLVDKGFVERDFKPIYGTLTKPAVYFLTGKGRIYLKDSYYYHFPKYLRRISRDSKASRIRCQIIADWYLMLFASNDKDIKIENSKTIIKTNIDIVNSLVTELTTDTSKTEEKVPLNRLQFFTGSNFPGFILLEKIKPDAYLRKRTAKGTTHGLLFVLDAYIPRFLLRYSLKHIFEALGEEYWEDDEVAALQIYYICPNNKIIVYLRRLLPSFLESYYGKKPLHFHFATRNEMYRQKNGRVENMKWLTYFSTDY